ncbi:long-chain-fatty-acid--CoA ligase [Sapientia aquatica]|uniref:Long-chain-fatty-acid--CoA ligase n=1 Tax=Sapientia aquatica TaxID=1549640 RepID=A0A4R5W1W6_9BURK|nr:long-chain-fatty-acid--CoA ligase [Sapientia aquatica]TDK65637.1 long-chain-fatty-acid--CoA ligase [Sapientia aquatica]
MNLTQALHHGLRERPHQTATVFRKRRQTYTQFVERVARFAGLLQGVAVKRGARVAILSLNSDYYLEYLYGCFWAGAVINPVNIRWTVNEIAYSLDDCTTAVLLVDDTFKHLIEPLRTLSSSLQTVIYIGEAACPEGMLSFTTLMQDAPAVPDANVNEQDLAAILYTGGTTGQPKGVMLSHANLCSDALSAIEVFQSGKMVTGLLTVPLFHVGGIAVLIQLITRLSTAIVLPSFSSKAVLAMIEKEEVTECFLVPTMIKMLIEDSDFAKYDTSSLIQIFYGAAPIDSNLLNRAITQFPRTDFAQVYGMTELSPVVAVLPSWYHTVDGQKQGKLGAAGRPIPNAEIKVVNEVGEEVASGSFGEIIARGPMRMMGYWNKPKQTAKALRNGWMHTGDAGYIDADGFLYVVDRLKDMIVTGGENVYSAEVENAILTLPQISQCAVVGVPDDKWGERVHAVVVLRDGQTINDQAIITHCRKIIAGYKCPSSIEYRSALPISAAGKILKYELRDPHWQGRSRKVG